MSGDVEFLSWALIAAWAVLVGYVLLLAARQRKLKREIAALKEMVK